MTKNQKQRMMRVRQQLKRMTRMMLNFVALRNKVSVKNYHVDIHYICKADGIYICSHARCSYSIKFITYRYSLEF